MSSDTQHEPRDIEATHEEHSVGDLIIDLSFAPEWAKTPPRENYYADSPGEPDSPRRSRSDARRGKGQRDRQDSAGRGRRTSESRGPDRRPRNTSQRRDRPPPRRSPPVRAAEVEVRFLPERQRLRRVVKELVRGNCSFPLMGIAWQFLSRPEACEVRIRPLTKDSKNQLHQCSLCQAAATRPELVEEHILSEHLDDYFVSEEITNEPPAGNYVCVARCGLSGTLLGPPNHHSYRERVDQVRGERYSHMSAAEYEDRIKVVRDPEAIEQWKTESSRSTAYRLKAAEDKTDMTRQDAIAYVKREILPGLIREAKTATMPATIAQRLSDPSLRASIREAWEKEKRFPGTLLGALRGALKHMRLYLFRVKGRGQYVSPIPPAPVDTDKVVPEIAEILGFLAKRPGCTRREIQESLRPNLDESVPQEVLEFFKPLLWLIERGHVIEFYDGSLAVPIGRGSRSAGSKRAPGNASAKPSIQKKTN